jgi:16S rRNA (adenine1518-N6/adenine1519-N6)-dimethyltransferase
MSLLEKTKFLLRRHRIFPNKRLGQNFMIESLILQNTVSYASLGQDDEVLDIGAGLGFLTQSLAAKCKRVLAVESDAKLVNILYEQLRNLSNIEIIHGDVLQTPIPRFNKVVSVPPYSISSPLLLWLFSQKFDCAIFIFQKEFVDRLIAPVGSEHYGWLAVVSYYYVEIEPFDDVPRWMFYPQPEVDSIIVRLKPKRLHPFTLKNEALFRQFAQSLFTRRNRKVRNAIESFVQSTRTSNVEYALKIVESFPFRDKRVRELAPEDFGALFNGIID